MSNYRGEELILFIAYKGSAPSAEVAEILAALDRAIGDFHRELGMEGIYLDIRDVWMGSIKFWLGLAGVALPAAKLETEYPGTLTQFLQILKIGMAMSADATLPAYAKTFLGLCARPVAEGRAKEVFLGNTENDGAGIRISGDNAITIVNNYYYGNVAKANQDFASGKAASTNGAELAGRSALDNDPVDGRLRTDGIPLDGDREKRSARPDDALDASVSDTVEGGHSNVPDAIGPNHERDNAPVRTIPAADEGGLVMGPRPATVDWTVRDASGRDILIGIDLDVGERTGVIVGRHILEKAIGRSDIGDSHTTAEERQRFEKAVRLTLVTNRPFHRTRFNTQAITAMRLDQDDFT